MRTHTEIIEAAGGSAKVRDLLDRPIKNVSIVQSWKVRNSIPPEYWNSFARAKLATLQELANAAEAKLQETAPA